MKKQLTLETSSGSGIPASKDKAGKADSLTTPEQTTGKEEDDDDDDLGRDDDAPMSREELEKQSSNSVSNLDRLNTEQADLSEPKNTMSKTLSSTQLKEMFEEPAAEEEGQPEK